MNKTQISPLSFLSVCQCHIYRMPRMLWIPEEDSSLLQAWTLLQMALQRPDRVACVVTGTTWMTACFTGGALTQTSAPLLRFIAREVFCISGKHLRETDILLKNTPFLHEPRTSACGTTVDFLIDIFHLWCFPAFLAALWISVWSSSWFLLKKHLPCFISSEICLDQTSSLMSL